MGSIYELAFSGRIGSQSGYTRTRKGINLLNDHDNERGHSQTTLTARGEGTVVGFKLSGHFKFFFDIINVRVTILDAKGIIK